MRSIIPIETAAVLDAPPANGKFPLLIYAPGASGSPFENSVFCEYMASHGYIVAAMPSMGAIRETPRLISLVFTHICKILSL